MDHQALPDFIVHYSRGEPFLSICALPEEQRTQVLASLNENNAWGLSRFAHESYSPQRVSVEKQMREEFIAKGGCPVLNHPIYFFLGRNQNFEKSPRNLAYALNLRDIEKEHISFTYGDSLLARDDSNRARLGEDYLNPLCSKLYFVDELRELIEDPLFPRTAPLHIEAQLWIRPATESVRRVFR